MPGDKKFPKLKQPKIKQRSSRKLLIVLLTFFIILLIILFFTSSITKINSIEITGNHLVTDLQIGQASQVKLRDHFFAVSSKTIENRILQIKTVKSVIVTKRFPGELHIQIIEFPGVAFQISPDGIKTLLLANGTKVDVDDQAALINKPILTGWTDDNRLILKLCSVLDKIPLDMLTDISEIKPDPSAVYPDKIKIYTRSQFEVTTTIGYLPDKIQYMKAIIEDQDPGFLIMLEANNWAPYKKDKSPENGK